jgi:peptide/nickel transport system substrate-binding protein
MPSRLASLVLLVAGALAVGSPLSAGAQGGVLRVAVPSVPGSLDPATAIDGPLPLVARQVFDTLVRHREGTSDVEAGLATHWAVSRDGLSWSFRLREGVRFHDGTPLEAGLVAASLERVLVPGHPAAPSANVVAARLFGATPGIVKEIRVSDARSVRINLLTPYAPLLTVLAHPGLSITLLRAGETGAGAWLGTGPFSVTEVRPGRIVLDANPLYWGGPSRLGRLVFLEEADPARAERELEARTLDLLLPAQPPSRAAGVLSVTGWRIGYLAIQTEKEPFTRKSVRRALAAALQPPLLSAALESTAVPLLSILPPGVWARREGSPLMTGDTAGARRLLADAGFPRGFSCVLLVAPSGAAAQNRLAEAVRASLSEAGINVVIRVEAPDMVLRAARAGEHEIVLLEAPVDGGDPHLLLHPLSASEGATKGPSATNLSFYRNRQLDDLLTRGSQIAFRPERQRIYGRAQALLADELPWIPLYVRLQWAVARPEVRGFRLHPSGHHRLDRVWLEGPGAFRPGSP